MEKPIIDLAEWERDRVKRDREFLQVGVDFQNWLRHTKAGREFAKIQLAYGANPFV